MSLEEAIAAVQWRLLCTQIHFCPPAPKVCMRIPKKISLAQPQQDWYSALLQWSLWCQGEPIPGLDDAHLRRSHMHGAQRCAVMLFTGKQMTSPVDPNTDT